MNLLKPGDRVRLPKHPASQNTTYWTGTFTGADVLWDKEKPSNWAWDKTSTHNSGLALL